MQGILPDEILGRRKQGLGTPLIPWFKGGCRRRARPALARQPARARLLRAAGGGAAVRHRAEPHAAPRGPRQAVQAGDVRALVPRLLDRPGGRWREVRLAAGPGHGVTDAGPGARRCGSRSSPTPTACTSRSGRRVLRRPARPPGDGLPRSGPGRAVPERGRGRPPRQPLHGKQAAWLALLPRLRRELATRGPTSSSVTCRELRLPGRAGRLPPARARGTGGRHGLAARRPLGLFCVRHACRRGDLFNAWSAQHPRRR